MSSCGSGCGCGSDCKCGNGCGCGEESSSTSKTLIVGVAPSTKFDERNENTRQGGNGCSGSSRCNCDPCECNPCDCK